MDTTQGASLVAMGGNSLLDPRQTPTLPHQFAVTARALQPVAALMARGERLVLTHGNGPQVGYMLLRSDLARGKLHEVPLDSLVANSQGSIGYMIQHELQAALQDRDVDVPLAAVVTQVEVAEDDPAFAQPSKPIGQFYSEDQAFQLQRDSGWAMVEDARRGWRRVVPSPEPLRIVELEVVRRLLATGSTVIACGGGGIPVVRRGGRLHGVEAVIDKDRVSALLASELGMQRLFITTGVDAIYADYLGDRQKPLRQVRAGELARLHAAGAFPPGSMGPKVEAALEFLSRGGREVVICLPEALEDAWDGRAGTRVLPD